MSHTMQTNLTVLTKGRQTWCPLMRQSTPSALAYKRMAQFFEQTWESKPQIVWSGLNVSLSAATSVKLGQRSSILEMNALGAEAQIRLWSRELQKSVESEAHTREENRHQWRYSGNCP